MFKLGSLTEPLGWAVNGRSNRMSQWRISLTSCKMAPTEGPWWSLYKRHGSIHKSYLDERDHVDIGGYCMICNKDLIND